MNDMFIRLIAEEAGATMVEYGLMLALIAAAIVGTVTMLGTNTSAKFDSVADLVSSAGGS